MIMAGDLSKISPQCRFFNGSVSSGRMAKSEILLYLAKLRVVWASSFARAPLIAIFVNQMCWFPNGFPYGILTLKSTPNYWCSNGCSPSHPFTRGFNYWKCPGSKARAFRIIASRLDMFSRAVSQLAIFMQTIDTSQVKSTISVAYRPAVWSGHLHMQGSLRLL